MEIYFFLFLNSYFSCLLFLCILVWITGRRITAIHLIMMILALSGELVLLQVALNAANEYSAIVDVTNADDISTLPYATYEGFISKEFNRFFFGANSNCQSKLIV
jgi:hypothetical protein